MRKLIQFSDNGDCTVKEGFEKFIQRKQTDNLSEETIEFYRGCYKYFTSYFASDSICRDITDDTVMGFVAYLRENNPSIANTSINSYTN